MLDVQNKMYVYRKVTGRESMTPTVEQVECITVGSMLVLYVPERLLSTEMSVLTHRVASDHP